MTARWDNLPATARVAATRKVRRPASKLWFACRSEGCTVVERSVAAIERHIDSVHHAARYDVCDRDPQETP